MQIKSGQTIECRRLPNGDMEYKPDNPKGIVWLMLNDIGDTSKADTHEIERIIRHADTYQGSGIYGEEGGHDISLLEIVKPTKVKFACLPNPTFDDIIPSKLAGYGKYLRNNGTTCMTDGQGPMKYHYCDQPGTGEDVCSKKPRPLARVCKRFFSDPSVQYEQGTYEDHKGKERYNELIIVSKNNGRYIALFLYGLHMFLVHTELWGQKRIVYKLSLMVLVFYYTHPLQFLAGHSNDTSLGPVHQSYRLFRCFSDIS